jgi:hypothetical protein
MDKNQLTTNNYYKQYYFMQITYTYIIFVDLHICPDFYPQNIMIYRSLYLVISCCVRKSSSVYVKISIQHSCKRNK